MEIPIRALGYSALTLTGREVLPGEAFEEESITMLLLARGAVIRLAAPVACGQNLIMLNQETNKYIHCRVASIRSSPEVKRYVEVEFTHAAPNFWGISFPKETAKAAPRAPQVSAGTPAEPSTETLWVVPKKAMAAANGAAPAVAATVAPALAPENPAAIPPIDWARPSEPDEYPSSEPFFLGRPTEGLPLCEPVLDQSEAAPASPPPTQWVSLSEPAPRRRGARRTMAATAVLSLLFGGYRVYLAGDQPVAGATSAETSAATVTQSQGDNSAETLQSARPSDGEAPGSMNTVTALPTEVSLVEPSRRRDLLISRMAMPVQNTASDSHDAPEITVFGGEEPASAVPQLNGEAPGAAGGLLSTAGPEPPPPPPPASAPENAGKPAAPLTPARLVSSVQPIYPLLAKQGHIEGNVTIEAQIDVSGKVAGMRVLSGPSVLRAAATDALAKWKYQPAQRGDQPTPISVIVIIRFVLR
ncbi:MAG TPA: energy transducer TonB [Candidatus Acidoferrales bacterium]|nr:energy transducer TonB [Candidatus Acidoferrales bacterium]